MQACMDFCFPLFSFLFASNVINTFLTKLNFIAIVKKRISGSGRLVSCLTVQIPVIANSSMNTLIISTM
jgi:predicted metal-binding membrane protein